MTYDVATPAAARLWHYPPDWKRGFSVRRSFLTDLIASRNNTEQRRALRDDPRVTVQYAALASGSALRAAQHFLRVRQNDPVAIPDYTRYVRTASLAGMGASALSVTSPPGWIADGQLLVLCGAAVSELVLCDGVAGSAVSLAAALDNAWPANSVLRPVFFGSFRPSLRSSRYKPDAAEIDVYLDCYPGADPESYSSADSFNGYEVITQAPDWSQPPGIDHIWPIEHVDYGMGRTAQFRPIERYQSLVEHQFTGLTQAATRAFEAVFIRAKGRRDILYHASCLPDMILAGDVTGTSFTVTGSAIADDLGAVDYGVVSQAIEIIQTDGTRLRRLVTNISASGSNSVITVDSSVTLTVATTASISWMPKVRFASDELTVNWLSPALAEIRVAMQTIDDGG